MGLTTTQSHLFQMVKNTSSSKQAVRLTDDDIRHLVYIAARDLGVEELLPPLHRPIPEFFSKELLQQPPLHGPSPKALFEMLVTAAPDADLFVSALAALHKARLKFNRILATQSFADMNQVGLRGLLEFGSVDQSALAGLLIWRKWLFDIDNRAAQDTGYFVEPVLAHAIGGAPVSARNSPIRRSNNSGKGRQVDCIKDDLAYEFKLRMTIAASGQGRWSEELQFATDCRNSNYTPVLVVLDPTESKKLTELKARFESEGGRCYIGQDAWDHLREQASPQMRTFMEKYVEAPLLSLFEALPQGSPLPDFAVRDLQHEVAFTVGGYNWSVPRSAEVLDASPDEANLDDSDVDPIMNIG